MVSCTVDLAWCLFPPAWQLHPHALILGKACSLEGLGVKRDPGRMLVSCKN